MLVSVKQPRFGEAVQKEVIVLEAKGSRLNDPLEVLQIPQHRRI